MSSDPMYAAHVLLQAELDQRREEGCPVDDLVREIDAVDENTPSAILDELYARLEALPVSADFPYQEPSDLDDIREIRPGGPRRLASPGEVRMHDKMRGAWLGRAAGCQLGKPVEGWERARIETYLRAADAYPLADYIPRLEASPVGVPSSAESTRGDFDCMARDDDIDYTIIGLHVLEQHGSHFTTAHVADTWLSVLPYHMVYTAERVTYRNLVIGHDAESAGTLRNPYREWIGAQIRADGWAYAAACWPEKAAELAWRDARLSHVKNGIYGEMWAAAMIAAAFAEDLDRRDPVGQLRRLIYAGISEIPARSRLTDALRKLVGWQAELDNWEDAWERLNAEYGRYHWIHTINNALVVALALLYSGGDFGRSISIAVMCGWDTDCNGATVGSVLGALLGADALPESWIAPLNDRTRSAVIGFDNSRLSDLARRSLAVYRQLSG
jgi:ADP-ribosylglycohydrolase